MEHLPEFLARHWALTCTFVVLVVLLVATRRGGRSLAPALVGNLVNRENAVLVDIRSDADFRAGHIAGSVGVPWAQFPSRVGDFDKYKGRPVIVVCHMGNTAGEAARLLAKAGHESVWVLAGGITAWRSDNLPVVKS